ncbi:MAG: type I-E CRISPR-associated protein Cas5/CasD [Thauera sp.]|nr:type I-E CRISPR-associated protein Cas5/CasD [Thauera sp.]
MSILVFQLQAPLASWGDTAVGEYRPSYDYPGISALVGLLGAALGLRREDESAHAALRDHYGYAVGVQSSGKLLRDYHTAQVPSQSSLKKRPHASRRDELAISKHDLNTILSTRDYRQDAACLVAVQASEQSPYSLEALHGGLRKPRFVLYLGRKACPPSAPLHPCIIDAATAESAFEAYLANLTTEIGKHCGRSGRPLLEPPNAVVRIAWGHGIHVDLPPDLTITRKDRPIRRKGWQFSDRIEHIALTRKEA